MVWLNIALTGLKIGSKAIKPIKKALKAYKKKTKVKPKTEIKSGKFNKSQFSVDDPTYGHPIVKNLVYKSKKSLKALDKRMSKKSYGYLGTRKISKSNYIKELKDRKN